MPEWWVQWETSPGYLNLAGTAPLKARNSKIHAMISGAAATMCGVRLPDGGPDFEVGSVGDTRIGVDEEEFCARCIRILAIPKEKQ